ncbi:nitrous oxide-stimulated promoter family protein [Salmonella enterica subsp. enterica]|nr:nitrous oxide-stimulated promoter family protein [Salmonella enterica subsp. enterica]
MKASVHRRQRCRGITTLFHAQKRLDKMRIWRWCLACKQCPVHCYQPAKREDEVIMQAQVRECFGGILVLTVRHLIDDKFVPELPVRISARRREAPA